MVTMVPNFIPEALGVKGWAAKSLRLGWGLTRTAVGVLQVLLGSGLWDDITIMPSRMLQGWSQSANDALQAPADAPLQRTRIHASPFCPS